MDFLLPASIQCPHCGQFYELEVDTSQGGHEMIEDCTVCCAPILVRIVCSPGEVISVDCSRG